MAIEKEKLIWMYRTMLRHRDFEDAEAREFAEGHIPGFVHLGQGEEAIGAGAIANLRPDDYVTSNHRCGSGHLIAKGVSPDRIMAEVFGKKTGLCKGKGGVVHMSCEEKGHLGSNGSIGAVVPIAAGAALSAKMRKTDQVCLCFFSDGAVNTSRFHEGMNLAAIWKLPVVYIIENNEYAETTHYTYASSVPHLADRARAYSMPGKTIDGNDVLAVYETVGEAVARARKGEGPSLIECMTWRQRGMFEGDSGDYRTKEEMEKGMKSDPIPRFRKKLIEMGVLTEQEADKIHQEVREEIGKAVKFAQESPMPDPDEELLTDVYA